MNRQEGLRQVGDSSLLWDVVIVGGGATGLGAAVDSAARGYRTLLLERGDFAQETSSRSTKLIHGGVRYLKQGQISMVRDSLRERGRLLRNAPDLVHRLPFLIPTYSGWDQVQYWVGLKAYQALSGSWSLGPTKAFSRDAVLRELATLNPDGLRGGVGYFDAQFDDARLAIRLAQTTWRLGGIAINRVEVKDLLKSQGRVTGVLVEDLESGRCSEVKARVVINATGIFSDELLQLDQPSADPLLALSQGAHIVLDRSFLPGSTALMIPKTADGRVLFAIPWQGRVLVGTTESAIPKPVSCPRPLRSEIEFLLEHSSKVLAKPPAASQILSAFAGIRPLITRGGTRSTSRLSREHAIVRSDSGLITVAGGKWTTYRRMAEQTVDFAALSGGLPSVGCTTDQLALIDPYGEESCLTEAVSLKTNDELGRPLHERFMLLHADVVKAVRWEMARTVEDVLARRSRALLMDARASIECAPHVARILAAELGKDSTWQQEEVATYENLAKSHFDFDL